MRGEGYRCVFRYPCVSLDRSWTVIPILLINLTWLQLYLHWSILWGTRILSLDTVQSVKFLRKIKLITPIELSLEDAPCEDRYCGIQFHPIRGGSLQSLCRSRRQLCVSWQPGDPLMQLLSDWLRRANRTSHRKLVSMHRMLDWLRSVTKASLSPT